MTKFLGTTAGVLSAISGAMLAAGHAFDWVSGGETTLGKLLVFFAHLSGVFAFAGIHAAQGERNRFWGNAGLLLGVAGSIVVCAVVFVETAAVAGAPVEGLLQSGANAAIATYGPLAFAFGLISIGVSIARGGVLPRTGGWLLVAGTVVFAAATGVEDASAWATTLGSALTGLGFVWTGVGLLRLARRRESPRGGD